VKRVASIVAVVVALGAVGCAEEPDGTDAHGLEVVPRVAADVGPSVVAIRAGEGEGSGVVYDEDGIVVTNAHVVRDATDVEVVFADGRTSPGEVLATDEVVDVAVIDVERDDVPAAVFADELPRVGELAIAVGNPLGFEHSVTAGIVSALHREIPGSAQQAPSLVDLVQTDAPISPGNSGGALVGGDGIVLGLNVAYIPPQARAVSIGFAIPAPTVTETVEELLEDGEADHAWLGLVPAPVTEELADRFDLGTDSGVLVRSVDPEGPAAMADIRAGDVIVGFGDERVASVEDLLAALRGADPGDEVPVTVVRDGEEQEEVVELGARP
jgi:serine protease DegQ